MYNVSVWVGSLIMAPRDEGIIYRFMRKRGGKTYYWLPGISKFVLDTSPLVQMYLRNPSFYAFKLMDQDNDQLDSFTRGSRALNHVTNARLVGKKKHTKVERASLKDTSKFFKNMTKYNPVYFSKDMNDNRNVFESYLAKGMRAVHTSPSSYETFLNLYSEHGFGNEVSDVADPHPDQYGEDESGAGHSEAYRAGPTLQSTPPAASRKRRPTDMPPGEPPRARQGLGYRTRDMGLELVEDVAKLYGPLAAEQAYKRLRDYFASPGSEDPEVGTPAKHGRTLGPPGYYQAHTRRRKHEPEGIYYGLRHTPHGGYARLRQGYGHGRKHYKYPYYL